jgi:16S rRNA processing protein RimM
MRLVVARIGRAHGVRGQVTVEVRTDVPERRFVPGAVLHLTPPAGVTGLPPELSIADAHNHQGTLLLTFDGIDDRGLADALRDCLLEVDVEGSSDEPDAWYDHELVGLRADAPDGAPLGEVVAVEHPGAQDLLVVRTLAGRRRLVPFVSALVPTVDVPGGRLVIAAPPGLLEDLPDEQA